MVGFGGGFACSVDPTPSLLFVYVFAPSRWTTSFFFSFLLSSLVVALYSFALSLVACYVLVLSRLDLCTSCVSTSEL